MEDDAVLRAGDRVMLQASSSIALRFMHGSFGSKTFLELTSGPSDLGSGPSVPPAWGKMGSVVLSMPLPFRA